MRRGHRKQEHRSDHAAQYRSLYNSPFWDQLRRAKLMRDQQCQRCHAATATVVHHIREHKGDRKLFFAYRNLMSVCKPCHDGPIKRTEYRGYSNEVGVDGFPLDIRHPANR